MTKILGGFRYDGTTASSFYGAGTAAPAPSSSYDWSADNLPWTYSSTDQFTALWPTTGVNIVDLQTGSTDFWTNLNNTVSAAGARCVVRLPAGTFHLNQFRMIGSSGDPNYAVGFWWPNLQGLLGAGPDQTIVQMDQDSFSTVDQTSGTYAGENQITRLHDFTMAAFQPSQMKFCRFDSNSIDDPILIAGVTFRGADQNILQPGAFASDVTANLPQPAPWIGVSLFQPMRAIVSYCRFQAAGHAALSQPPFETAGVQTQYSSTTINNCEFDGRLAPELDAAQPRRNGVIMANNETLHEATDCWFHHSNLSKYAANDQNRSTFGVYNLTRVKLDHISDNHNVDPVYGDLGGSGPGSCSGFENCAAAINMTDVIMEQDGNSTSRGVPQHVQFTMPGTRNDSGGRFHVTGGVWRNPGFPSLDGFLCVWVTTNTKWYVDGIANTFNVQDSDGNAKTPYVVTGSNSSWPPSAATLTAAGVAPETHYILRATAS